MSRSSAPHQRPDDRPDRDVGGERREHGVAQEPRVDVGAHQRHEDQAGDRQRHRQAGDELDVVGPARAAPSRSRSPPAGRPARRPARPARISGIGRRSGAQCGSFAAAAHKAFPARVDRMSTGLYHCRVVECVGSAGDVAGIGKIRARSGGPAPGASVPRRDLRRRPDLQQHQRVVGVDPRGEPAAQGPAVLPPARRERDLLLRRLRLGAEPGQRRLRRARSTIPRSPRCSARCARAAATTSTATCTEPTLPAPEARPGRAPALRPDHLVAVVLRAGGAGVVRQDAEPRPDRQVRGGCGEPGRWRDDAVLLVGADDDQVRDRPAGEVADEAVALVDRLRSRCRGRATSPSSRRR